MKHLKLFEEFVFGDIASPSKINNKLYYANAKEMDEIDKVREYYTWWYSNPAVISKINLGNKNANSVKDMILQFLKKKLIPSQFRIFRSLEDEAKFYEAGNIKTDTFAIGWIINLSDPIYIRLYDIEKDYTPTSFFSVVLHEVAHLIQMACGGISIDLHNPKLPKGSYGTDSIKRGLFLPPLDEGQFKKKYSERELEQFARFHVMRYYFGIKPTDNCNQILKKVIDSFNNGGEDGMFFNNEAKGLYDLKLIQINGNYYLLGDLRRMRLSELGFSVYIKKYAMDISLIKDINGWEKSLGIDAKNFKEFKKKHPSFFELDIICHDHQNIVSNLGSSDSSFA